MEKVRLSNAHLEKRAEKKRFSLRYDILGSYLQRETTPEDYFDLFFAYPKEADRILIDGMYGGDWYSVYESKVLPLRRNPFLTRFHRLGVDLFGEWVKHVHSEKKECFLVHRIGEVAIEEDVNPVKEKTEHPDWFIPAYDHLLPNMASPEIRAHKLRLLDEVMRKYDFDGLDIDFERHTPILEPGRQWELCECVTDFMRELRRMLLKIEEETGRVIQLSARVPDCLFGCHEDGLDIETWLKEDLVDALTLGSRSYDVHAEDFRALTDIQLFGCYEVHHTLDGYALPSLDTIRGVFYSWRVRGADGIEYFNWCGQGDIIRKYITLYGFDPIHFYAELYANDDFTGICDQSFLEKADKTYIVDRRGGYPWGVGYGNQNNTKQLPLAVDGSGTVEIYLPENIKDAKRATLRVITEELDCAPRIYFEDTPVAYTAKSIRDKQITTNKTAPNSGTGVFLPMAQGKDLSKPCTLFEIDVTGHESKIGYNRVRLESDTPTQIEKVELTTVR